MANFAGCVGQAGYVDRIRTLPPDHFGHVVSGPVEFDLTLSDLARFVEQVRSAQRSTSAGSVRIGIEAAGHYHWALASTLRGSGFDVVELNPYHVKVVRAQLGQARLKTDLRDCLAMVELLVRGQGWPLHRADGAIAEQRALVATDVGRLLQQGFWEARSIPWPMSHSPG